MAASTSSYQALTALDGLVMPGKPCPHSLFPASLNDAEWSNRLPSQQIRVESAGRPLM